MEEINKLEENTISQISTETILENVIPRKIRYRPILKVDVVFNNYQIEYNYRKIVSIEQSKIEKDVNYFRKYLFHLHGCEKTKEEIESILININFIKKYVLKKLNILDPSVRKKVVDVIVLDNHFYKRRSNDLTVKLYRFLYDNKPSILKCYFFFPDFAYYTSMMETRFENEVIFQEYAMELNHKHNFITPKIYDYGSCLIKLREKTEENKIEENKVKCMFLIMEDIDGLILQNTEFKTNTCTDIYKLERDLQCELLSHNDFTPRNIILKTTSTPDKNEYIILDYGEATLCGTLLHN